MRRLHQHGVSGLDAGVQISEHFRKRARAHDALGIHAGALAATGFSLYFAETLMAVA